MFYSGSGTPEDPYVITNIEQLQMINEDLSAHYVLGCDIDASAQNFNSIGSETNPFMGALDGRGRSIIGLRASEGLFVHTLNANLRNLRFVNPQIQGIHAASVLASQAAETTISNCVVEGGEVNTADSAGGLVCAAINTHIVDCCTTTKVSGKHSTGGFVGILLPGCVIERCYSTGEVTASLAQPAGFCGRNLNHQGMGYSQITDCFWDMEASKVTIDCPYEAQAPKATGLTATQMKQRASFTNWDFESVWNIEEGVTYPWLRVVTEEPGEPTKYYTAQANGNIADLGGTNCTRRGFVYGKTSRSTPSSQTDPLDATYDECVEEIGAFSTGQFSMVLTNLEPNAVYYVRAFAQNEEGFGYGGEVTFTTPN